VKKPSLPLYEIVPLAQQRMTTSFAERVGPIYRLLVWDSVDRNELLEVVECVEIEPLQDFARDVWPDAKSLETLTELPAWWASA
jgi:hypothetical protein